MTLFFMIGITKLYPHPSWIEINLKQFRKNVRYIRERIGSSLYCLPVKADAYGHGMLEIAKVAEEERIDYLGVSCLKEGASLRQNGISLPILVFGAVEEDQIEDLILYDLEFTIGSHFKSELVEKVSASLGKISRIHLKVDTGMQRTGVRPSSFLKLFESIQKSAHLNVVGIYSHLAMGDHPFTEAQIETFLSLKKMKQFPKMIWHLANSVGAHFYPKSHLDMVRVGLMSYGYLPDGSFHPIIRPCFSLKSKISYFKVVETGTCISYGHTYQTQKQSRIVTVPIGYGDGYSRLFSNKAPVLIRGKRYQVSGNICMDQFMVDIGNDEAFPGDTVTLIGKDHEEVITVEELASLNQTIPYEILTFFNQRVSRFYS